jgi:hypothetical protein
MRIRTGALTLLLALVVGSAGLQAQESIEGAWEIVEVWGETAAGDAWSFGDAIQPSVFIFLDGYYSFTAVNAPEARPLPPEGVARPDLPPEYGESVWRTYLSNSGTYEVDGETLVTHPTVALWPPFMAEDSRPVYELEWDGQDLLVTTRAGDAWRIWRLQRLP